MPRFYTPQVLSPDLETALDAASARHVQVLRMQPGHGLTLFNGQGGEYSAEVTQMGRSEVRVRVEAHDPVEREAARAVHLVIGMPANERMEWLVEKATELGVASIQPLMTERTVLRLSGERAEKKVAHWQAIAVAACEQSGRNRVPIIHPVLHWSAWLSAVAKRTAHPGLGCVLSVHSASVSAHAFALCPGPTVQAQAETNPTAQASAIECICGPEGGLGPNEETAALACGYTPVSLGARVLRSETAPLAALSLWVLATD
ncbi:MAG: 16S rRNA (uracil(1498)-N(3))-methyltransferase [Burkholderiaceae bacterium]